MTTKMRYLKLKRKVINKICSRIYIDRERDISKCLALISGTGRSGTTWLADIIGSQIPCRIMFEPFHPKQVKQFSQFHYFQYMRPSEQHHDLLSYCHKLLSGNIRDPWIDRQVNHLFPEYRLIKAIRANLFLKWFNNNFPTVPILLAIRHPCAVVLSYMELSWDANIDISSFLSQNKLIDDFLSDKLEIIQNAKTPEEKSTILWCISNLVPLKQFQSGQLNVFFYENLCTQPEIEIPRIFNLINQQYNKSVFEYLERPSTTSQSSRSAIMTGGNKITKWKEKLSAEQINRILSIVKAFELDYLYDDSCTPLRRI